MPCGDATVLLMSCWHSGLAACCVSVVAGVAVLCGGANVNQPRVAQVDITRLDIT